MAEQKISKYTIMHEETPVLLFDRKADVVTVYEPKYLLLRYGGLRLSARLTRLSG